MSEQGPPVSVGEQEAQIPNMGAINQIVADFILIRGKDVAGLALRSDSSTGEVRSTPDEQSTRQIVISDLLYKESRRYQVLGPASRYIWDANDPSNPDFQRVIIQGHDELPDGTLTRFNLAHLQDLESLIEQVGPLQKDEVIESLRKFLGGASHNLEELMQLHEILVGVCGGNEDEAQSIIDGLMDEVENQDG
ncbi:hypothetical protein COU91_04215 [Candidatus Saccharibacteria bacterium CG10_big_fil_rev_8_21_14_0_10_47_8]|nr:MAG: hypothetical protein COU91_04215 [Candidatus Saccharibacteria bacterium CG10_big_fil_rev_8_21_14_0_10_47_8]